VNELDSGIAGISFVDGDDKKDEKDHKHADEHDFCDHVKLNQLSKEVIQKKYKFIKLLGEGAFGKVHLATLTVDPSKKFAIKSIDRDTFNFKGEGE